MLSLFQNILGPLESQCSCLFLLRQKNFKKNGGESVRKTSSQELPILSLLPSPGPGTKAHPIQLSGCFVPVGPAPIQGPFWPFFFPLSKEDLKGSQGPVAGLPGYLTEYVVQ